MRCFMLLWGKTGVLKTMQTLDNKIHSPLGRHHSDLLSKESGTKAAMYHRIMFGSLIG